MFGRYSVVVLLLAQGCFKNGEVSAEYARQMAASQLRVASVEEQLTETLRRVEQLEDSRRTEREQREVRLENIEQVNTELTTMRGVLEVLRFDLDELMKNQEGDLISRERRALHAQLRLDQLETFLGVTAPPVPSDTDLGLVGPNESSVAGEPVDSSSQQPPVDGLGESEPMEVTIASVREKLDGGFSKAARALAERALAAGTLPPEDTVEMTYLIGETWRAEESWLKAAQVYKTVSHDGEGTEWGPWATLRLAECFDGLNKPSQAKLFYKKVVQDHPKTEAGRLAKEKLSN